MINQGFTNMNIQIFTKFTKSNCAITAFWLTLTIVCAAFVLESCAAPRGIRNKTQKQKESYSNENSVESKESTVKSTEQSSNQNSSLPDFNNFIKTVEAKKASTGKKGAVTEKGNSNNDATYQAETSSNDENRNDQNNQIHIPTIKEQLNKLSDEHNKLKYRVDNIENDVSYIKYKMNQYDEATNIYDSEKNKETIAGEHMASQIKSKKSTAKSSKDEYVIYSDEEFSENKSSKDDLDKTLDETVTDKPQKKEIAKENKKANKKVKMSKQTAHSQPKNNKVKKDNSLEKTVQQKKTSAIPTENSSSNAMAKFQSKNYESAVSEFSKSLETEKDPQKINMYNYYLGESYFALKQYDRSVKHFQKVINSGNSYKKAEAQIMLGEAHVRSGQTAEARRAFETLIEKYPKSQYVPRARKLLQQM